MSGHPLGGDWMPAPSPKRSRTSRLAVHLPRHLGDRVTDQISRIGGSWKIVLLYSVWFGYWIVRQVEPFPYGLLTMIVSLLAIYLSTFVLMAQNRQAEKDRRRDDLEAQEVEELAKINAEQLVILQAVQTSQSVILARLDELEARGG